MFFTFCIIVCTFLLFFSGSVNAQVSEDAVIVSDTLESDTLKSGTPLRKKDRKAFKATVMSAVLPGLGQVYNKRYWKVPIIYGLGGVIVYFYNFNNQNYQMFKKTYEDTVNLKDRNINFYTRRTPQIYDKVNLWTLSPERAKFARDSYRRDRDFNSILMLGLYVLNILDATVDAHLKSFDVSDNLTLQLDPKFNSGINNALGPGISLNFKFK